MSQRSRDNKVSAEDDPLLGRAARRFDSVVIPSNEPAYLAHLDPSLSMYKKASSSTGGRGVLKNTGLQNTIGRFLPAGSALSLSKGGLSHLHHPSPWCTHPQDGNLPLTCT